MVVGQVLSICTIVRINLYVKDVCLNSFGLHVYLSQGYRMNQSVDISAHFLVLVAFCCYPANIVKHVVQNVAPPRDSSEIKSGAVQTSFCCWKWSSCHGLTHCRPSHMKVLFEVPLQLKLSENQIPWNMS